MSSHKPLPPLPCSGYLTMKIADDEDNPDSKIDLARFFVLDKGHLVCYDEESSLAPGKGEGDGEHIDLVGYTLEIKSSRYFILKKEEDDELMVVELECDIADIPRWSKSFENHLLYINHKIRPYSPDKVSLVPPVNANAAIPPPSAAVAAKSVIVSPTLTKLNDVIPAPVVIPVKPISSSSGEITQSFSNLKTSAGSPVNIPETIDECDESDDPERCYGYVDKESKPGSGHFESIFLVLEDCELFVYRSEEKPGEGSKPPLLIIDLDGWSIAFPSKKSIILTPPPEEIERRDQILLEVSNSREYNKWSSAFNEHMQILNMINEVLPVVDVSSEIPTSDSSVASQPCSSPLHPGKAVRRFSCEPDNMQLVQSALMSPPSVAVLEAKAASEQRAEFIDGRGIKMEVNPSTPAPLPPQPPSQFNPSIATISAKTAPIISSSNKLPDKSNTLSRQDSAVSNRSLKYRYPDETIAILRSQLVKEGQLPLEYMPLGELKQEMQKHFDLANQGKPYDEGRLDYLLKCLDLNPDYQAEKEKENAAWRNQIDAFAKESLETMRGFIPPHIFNSTQQTLTTNDGVSLDLAKRILSKKCLWLIRVSVTDINKMHVAELQGRFNHEAQGLDLIELAAIFASVPPKFLNDDAKGSKEKWRASLEDSLKQYYMQHQKGTLPKLKQRNPAYKGLQPLFTQDELNHSMNVTSSQGAFNSRASFRLLNKRHQASSRRSLIRSGSKPSNSTVPLPDF